MNNKWRRLFSQQYRIQADICTSHLEEKGENAYLVANCLQNTSECQSSSTRRAGPSPAPESHRFSSCSEMWLCSVEFFATHKCCFLAAGLQLVKSLLTLIYFAFIRSCFLLVLNFAPIQQQPPCANLLFPVFRKREPPSVGI